MQDYLMARTLDLLDRQDNNRESRRSGSKKEPNMYGGTNDNLTQWLEQMELYFQVNDIEFRKRGAIAKQYLKDTAQLVIRGHERSLRQLYGEDYVMTWEDISRKLETEFASVKARSMLETTWNKRVQEPKEKVIDYINYMRDVGHRLNKTETEIVNKIKCTLSSGLEYFVSTEDPKTVAQLSISAQRIEEAGIADWCKKPTKTAKMEPVREMEAQRPVAGLTPEIIAELQNPFKENVELLKNQIKQLQNALQKRDNPPVVAPQITTRPDNRFRGRPTQAKNSNVQCWLCGELGHVRKSCPRKVERGQVDMTPESKGAYRPGGKAVQQRGPKSDARRGPPLPMAGQYQAAPVEYPGGPSQMYSQPPGHQGEEGFQGN
jgi:curved DNA-binding protein CbpA